ncbi:ferritin-like fold-containing protein [Micromonospora zamorensis]|uniref:ferritin-like fold-containing protein n=1 Tax=Micromonospora zamorensis TaxID=709883 RepID=UPI0033BB8BE3
MLPEQGCARPDSHPATRHAGQVIVTYVTPIRLVGCRWPALVVTPSIPGPALEEPDRAAGAGRPHDSRCPDFAAAEIRVAVADDSRVAGRLSMWARRLGEALSQASRFRRRAGRTHRADRAGRPGRRAGGCSAGSPPRTQRGWPPPG